MVKRKLNSDLDKPGFGSASKLRGSCFSLITRLPFADCTVLGRGVLAFLQVEWIPGHGKRETGRRDSACRH